MKRDMELVRKILLAIEEEPTGRAPRELKIEGYTDDEIGHHAYLMAEAGLIDGARVDGMHSPSRQVHPTVITWAGHEFLAASRDESIWKKAMGIVKEKGGAVTVGVLTQLLTNLVKNNLGLP